MTTTPATRYATVVHTYDTGNALSSHTRFHTLRSLSHRRSTRGMTTATSSPAGSGTSSSASNSRQSSPRPVRSASALGMVPPSSKKHAATSTGDDNKNSDNTRRTMSAKRRLESSSNETSPVGGNGNDSNNDKENSRLRRAVKQAKVVVSVEVVPRKVSPRKTTCKSVVRAT